MLKIWQGSSRAHPTLDMPAPKQTNTSRFPRSTTTALLQPKLANTLLKCSVGEMFKQESNLEFRGRPEWNGTATMSHIWSMKWIYGCMFSGWLKLSIICWILVTWNNRTKEVDINTIYIHCSTQQDRQWSNEMIPISIYSRGTVQHRQDYTATLARGPLDPSGTFILKIAASLFCTLGSPPAQHHQCKILA